MTAGKRFAVVGRPVAQSRSPEIFAALSAASGVPLQYERIEIADETFDALFAESRRRYDGWNVTAPHKTRALAAADAVSDDARTIGAANVVTFRDGRATASNTDVGGVTALLARAGADPRGATVTVLGAGGAARATVIALARGGAASVTVTNRTPERAAALIDELRTVVGTTALLAGDADEGSSIVINATSDGAAVAPAVEACAPSGWCIDLQYRPSETPFVLAAQAAGRNAIGGGAMLVAQAIATFRIWCGDVAFDANVDAHLMELVEAP